MRVTPGMKAQPGQHRLLHTWSGGLDSTYSLWRLLEIGFDVVSVHVQLKNKFNRHLRESESVESVMEWFKERGLAERLELRRAGIDYGDTVIPRHTRTIELCRPLAAYSLRDPDLADISIIVASGIQNDSPAPPQERVRIHRAVESAAKRSVFLMRATSKFSKAKVALDTPDDLRLRCWSCNHPTDEGECGECSTCKHLETIPELRPDRPTGIRPLTLTLDRPTAGIRP